MANRTEPTAAPQQPDPSSTAAVTCGIERTPAFQYAIRDQRRNALEDLAHVCSDRDAALHKLEALLKQNSDLPATVAREFTALREQIETQHKSEMADRRRLDEETASARTALDDLDATIARHAAHEFSEAERKVISDQANAACEEFAHSVNETDRQLDELEKTLGEKQGQFERDSKMLAESQQEMESLGREVSTDALRSAISAAEEAARKMHTETIETETAAITSLETAVKEYAARAKTAAREKKDWEKKASLTPDHRTWAVWLESHTTDFTRQARNAARRQSSAEEKLEETNQKLIAARNQFSDAPARLAQALASAASEARTRFTIAIEEALDKLAPVVVGLREETSALTAQIESLTAERSRALENHQACIASEARKAEDLQHSQALASRATAAHALTDAESRLAAAPAAPASLNELLA